MKKAVLSVTNDLFTDPRVDKVCHTLCSLGYEVLLIGRCYRNSPVLSPRIYKTKRLHLFFRKGAFFYAEYNLRLFFFLLFQSCDVLVANDLDTLLPNYLISKFRKKKMVYDSHEYFLGLMSLAERRFVKSVWTKIEKFCFPKLTYVITVSESIADLYQKEYGIKVHVVRNIPKAEKPIVKETRLSLGIPEDKTIVIFQGNGINEGRGGEELINAVSLMDNILLLIIGQGVVVPKLKLLVAENGLSEKVRFIDRMTPENLFTYTFLSDIGISIDKDTSINLRFSLPNKIFEYIRAEIPVIVSNLPERAKIIQQYNVGKVIDDFEPQTIANAIKEMIDDKEQYLNYKKNCINASQQLTWENEEKKLEQIYKHL